MQSFKKGTKSIAVLILLSSLMTGSLTSCSSGDGFLSTVTVPEESKGTVCFINDSTVSENYYYSIEEGLSNAQKGDTVYVIPGSTTVIEEDCVIKEGVTLSLPYEGTRYTNGDDYTDCEMRGFADAFIDSIDHYRKSLVIINEGVTLTIEDEGSLIIGGYTGYPYSGTVGQTTKEYSEMLMLSDSKIEAKGASSITCYGYIKEATYIKDEDGNWNLYGDLNNGSRIEMSTESSFLAPLVFYDYKAGFNTLMMTNHDVKVSPVEMFDFPNLQVETLFNSDGINTSSFKGEYKIGVNGVPFTDTCSVVGYDESSMIGLTEGSLSIKYTPRLAGFTQKQNGFKTYAKMESAGRCDGTQDEDTLLEERKSTSGTSYEDDDDCTNTVFRVNGVASLNKVVLKLKVALVSLDIDTSEFDFPVSYRFSFVIGDEESSSFTVNYATKLLPGCNITVNENSKVLIEDSLIMYPSYESYEYTYWNSQSDKTNYYPTGFEEPYVLNNGTVSLEENASFGGTLHTEKEGSLFDARKGNLEATSYYGKTYGWNDDWASVFKDYTEWDTLTQSAKGYTNGELVEFTRNTEYVF